jgi:type IV pilus assembly protein PilA
MDTKSNPGKGTTNARVIKRRSAVLPIIGAVTFILVLAVILIPGQIVSRVARNEANAMESLHALTHLEVRYAAAHPSKGFTCDFALLNMEAPSNGEQIHEGFLFSDSFEGYKFSLTGCEVDPKGVAVRYKATAVPLLLGKTGFRAFCTDQTGELRYGNDGSVESCRPL